MFLLKFMRHLAWLVGFMMNKNTNITTHDLFFFSSPFLFHNNIFFNIIKKHKPRQLYHKTQQLVNKQWQKWTGADGY